jgi:hypothetical protein
MKRKIGLNNVEVPVAGKEVSFVGGLLAGSLGIETMVLNNWAKMSKRIRGWD